MLTQIEVSVIAQACTIRYDRGETDIQSVVESYGFSDDHNALVFATILSKRPDINL
ncbi:hypothetical protein [Paenibacillus pinisoli]|uniref:hypothetical protein n=1 Tax=Paenibacillus pinisoli TaxID=1276110 RepID=UPI0014035765|nr:hypothetical protein [Paenibacillus pinisoli]